MFNSAQETAEKSLIFDTMINIYFCNDKVKIAKTFILISPNNKNSPLIIKPKLLNKLCMLCVQ